uniref:EndoU domain-containing protein n=1 Tax=Acrobeloides nanus TaxID=290746 RepID=A0A914D280_9BILA
MREADVDKAKPEDIVLNWGSSVKENNNNNQSKLFSYVNKSLFNRPIYSNLIAIYEQNLFNPDACQPDYLTSLKNISLERYLTILTNSSVFRLAYKYLVDQS